MMQTVQLADTGRTTTRLGYGCSSIMGGMGRRDSLRVLQWAYDAGVRHFDVAPMYGFGEAESCLGEFLARHPGKLTVATKFGIPPAGTSWKSRLIRSVARPVLKALPMLKKRAQGAASSVEAPRPARDLSVGTARASLARSLHDLRVERVDLLLLHDIRRTELEGSPLLQFLQDAKREGTIGAFGIGTDPADVAAILADFPAYAPVIQREWSVFDAVEQSSVFHIYHRSLAQHRRRLERYLADDAVAARWSTAVGADLRAPGTLSALMMRAALRMNPGSIVLFSSKDRAHIQRNAELGTPSEADAQAEALYRTVQAEAANIPAGGAA